MPKARLVFNGDGVYTEKVARIYKLKDLIEGKIDSIPGVIDALNSASTTDALSANMGRVLQEQINNLSGMNHFISSWDCTTGLPTTEPTQDPYTYSAGDYYIVSKVSSGGTNYRPHGATYTHGVPSTAVETETVGIFDWYIYDGSTWILQPASNISIVIDSALSTTSTNPVENRVITGALDTKQDVINDLATIRAGAALGATALQSGDNITELVNNAGYQNAGDVVTAISGYIYRGTVQPANPAEGMLWYDTVTDELKTYDGTSWSTISGGATYTAGANIQISPSNVISATDTQYTAGTNISISSGNVISSIDTTYTAGDGINIDNNNEISNTGVLSVNGNNGTVTVDEFSPDNQGSTGQVLKKTANGYEWANESGGGGTGDVTGPNSSTDGDIVLFDGNTGKIIKDSGVGLSSKADTTDVNTKTFYLLDNQDLVNAQAAYDWYLAGKNPIIKFSTEQGIYTLYDTVGGLRFVSTRGHTRTFQSMSQICNEPMLSLEVSNGTVTRITEGIYTINSVNIIAVGIDYSTPYTPEYAGSPATKKYVDDNVIQVGSTAPSSPIEGMVWYDTVNDVLKTYDGTQWNTVSGGGGATYTAGEGIAIDGNNEISIDTTGATAGQVLSVNAQGNTTWTTPSGGTAYTAGDGINIDASNIVSNTMYPTNQGSAGQVLKIDGNGDTYWANESGGGGETVGAGERIYLQRNTQIRDNKGPCQSGWHVPTNTEMQALFQHMSDLGFDDTHPSDYERYLHMPMWGHLEHSVDTIVTTAAYYWTCEADSSYSDNANALGISTIGGITRFSIAKSWAAFIRPFKDTVEVPDQYWTTVYDGSSVAAGAGIFTNWSGEFISVSGDGTNWITIYNKNLGATDQREPGYVPANSNAGLFYQWGNNHGFTGDGGDWSYYTVSTSGYGPGNYYNKPTFITCQGIDSSWDSPQNNNLWGGVTQSTGTYTLINAEQINQATVNTIGGIKLGSDTIQTELAQSPTSDSGRTFPIQLDSYGNAVVNVPGGGSGGASIKQYTTYTSAGTANKEVYNLDISAGDLVSVRFANGNSASNVYIVDSTDPTISYPVTIGGASTNNNNFHVAHGGEVLMYFNGGALCAYSTMEDTIYTAGTGISISSGSISNTGVTSVNNSTGDVTVNEVSSGGNTGQVLTKTNNGYGWSNAPVTSVNSSTGDVTIRDVPASGSIGAVLTRINASNWGYDWQTISQFAPSNSQSATAGQILKKTQNGYEWADEYSNASNVRSWNVYGTPTNAQMKEIFFWLLDSYASNYLQGCAILKSTSQLDTYVFDYVTYTMEGSDTIINLVFLGIQRVSEVVRHATSGTGDYTHARARRMTISVNVGDLQNPNPETFTYSAVEDWNTDSSQITNYLSCIGSGYTTPFIPTQDHQPTSKKYVDDVAAGKVSDGAYDATTWNGVTTIAPSKGAVRDKIEDVISTLTPGLSVISGDSGTDYQIKIASMNPSTGTNNNIITLVI